ncbi:MAG: hypothetical protein WCL27_15985 [Betaproteobacteria bacterium]
MIHAPYFDTVFLYSKQQKSKHYRRKIPDLSTALENIHGYARIGTTTLLKNPDWIFRRNSALARKF